MDESVLKAGSWTALKNDVAKSRYAALQRLYRAVKPG
jgi:hypothetical protein